MGRSIGRALARHGLLALCCSFAPAACSDPAAALPCGGCPAGQFCGTDDRCHTLCVSDGDCGECSRCDGGLCVDTAGCRCIAETPTALCARLGTDCGRVSAADLCGTLRSVECGVGCAVGERCDDNQCTCVVPNPAGGCCVPVSDAELCTIAGAECGTFLTTDNCGVERSVQCVSSCTDGKTCDGTACVCQFEEANECTSRGYECATKQVTLCGDPVLLDCGDSCALGVEACNPSTNQCDCVAESDAELCAAATYGCGALTVTDRCGVSRLAHCGGCDQGLLSCTVPETCVCTGTCACVDTPDGDPSINEGPSGYYHSATTTWLDDVPPVFEGGQWRSCTMNTTAEIESHCLSVRNRQNHVIGTNNSLDKILVFRSSGSCTVNRVWLYSRPGVVHTWDGIDITAPLTAAGLTFGEMRLTYNPRSNRVVGADSGGLVEVIVTGTGASDYSKDETVFANINGAGLGTLAWPVFDAAGNRLFFRRLSNNRNYEAPWDGIEYWPATELAGTGTDEINDASGVFHISGATMDGLEVVTTRSFRTVVFTRAALGNTLSIALGPYDGFWFARPIDGCANLIGTQSPGGCAAEGIGIYVGD